MDYIRYHEVEKLFEFQPTLEGMLESLSVDLIAARAKEPTGTDEDYIYNLCIGNKALDNLPPTGKITDSTSNIAINYIKIMRRNKNEVKNELKREMLEISLVIDKLNIAFRRLTPSQQQILKLCYWEKKTWKETMECIKEKNQYISLRQAQEQRRAALEKMTSIAKITIDTYKCIMKLINEKFAS